MNTWKTIIWLIMIYTMAYLSIVSLASLAYGDIQRSFEASLGGVGWFILYHKVTYGGKKHKGVAMLKKILACLAGLSMAAQGVKIIYIGDVPSGVAMLSSSVAWFYIATSP